MPESFQTIQSYVERGYTLSVRRRLMQDGERYHARVDLGDTATSSNAIGMTLMEALEGLEAFLLQSAKRK